MSECFQFKQMTEETTEILIYGDIAKAGLFEVFLGVSDPTRMGAFEFREALEAVDTPNIRVRINSYGGSVSEGLAIYNLLRSCGKNVTTVCDGFACSAASVIFCAGTTRIMPKTALLMIHNAWTEGGQGNAKDFRKLADDLDKITQPSVEAYKAVSNLDESVIRQLMDDESWITAEDALEWGFATEIPEEEARQSLEQTYVYHMVERMKDMERKLSEMQHTPEPTAWEKFFAKK